MADWLPDGWQIETRTDEEDTKQKYFINKSTGEIFYTAADMVRYATYLKNVEPYFEKFKKTFADPDEIEIKYVDRPWEIDVFPALNAYVQTLIAESKKTAAGDENTSTAEAVVAVTEMLPPVEAKIQPAAAAYASSSGKGKRKKRKAKNDY